ncbi:MAG TPA: PfkB family carbohydrate kinase, partial [Paracoccaceae bacterium]|nr:PfkB family carbohydrate kinase [Paracoccaceae bacterium]
MRGGLLQLSGAVVDLVYRVDALPAPGAEAMAESFQATAGGGFNALVAARRAGLDAAYGGGLGTGPFAEIVRAALAAEGIPVHLPRCETADQGTCVVLVEPSGERSFVSKGGAEGVLTDDMLATLRPERFRWALLSGYTLAYSGSREALARFVASLPAATRFVFDPSPVVASIPGDCLGPVLA